MKRKRILTILAGVAAAIAVLVALFVVYWHVAWTRGFRTEDIRQGFSSELKEGLQSRYQIAIPDNAVFIKGVNARSVQDPAVIVLFHIPLEGDCRLAQEDPYAYVARVLQLDEEYWSNGKARDEERFWDDYEALGGRMDWQITPKEEMFTVLSFSVSEDILTVRLYGWRPGAEFP